MVGLYSLKARNLRQGRESNTPLSVEIRLEDEEKLPGNGVIFIDAFTMSDLQRVTEEKRNLYELLQKVETHSGKRLAGESNPAGWEQAREGLEYQDHQCWKLGRESLWARTPPGPYLFLRISGLDLCPSSLRAVCFSK